ncbi:hypothetical protein A4H97_12385 [Niastella yeongjuensis]|uniref:DUF4440 domain-containing protein n=1 Tax=Niastella yeongjuensis TaxID=354355 RepID=A0A1V9EA02_9BACT|nr:DUF4440 domain-containing protein [Niastella yeongjuensis]OQP42943.1 hypothetical protein A4H97_12385 [Niastella yeongjuensis]
MKIPSLGSLFLLLVLGACNQPVDKIKEEAKLMQLSRELSKLSLADSTETILSYWADDAVVMPPGHPPIKGKMAIKNMLLDKARTPGFKVSWEPKSVVISKSGDLAYITEENQISVYHTLGKSFINVNKGISIWRKENDSWKKLIDIWNTDPFCFKEDKLVQN